MTTNNRASRSRSTPSLEGNDKATTATKPKSKSNLRKNSPPHPSPSEYAAAIAVLSEATMSQACALLLSERDYQQDGEEKDDGKERKSDRSQLLEILAKCQKAHEVIQKSQDKKKAPLTPKFPSVPFPPSSLPPGGGPLLAPPPRGHPSRVQAKPLKPQSVQPHGKKGMMLHPRRTGMPLRRTGPPASSTSLSGMKAPLMKGLLQRQESDSSSVGSLASNRGGASGGTSTASNKRQRLSPPADVQQGSSGGKLGGKKATAAPPPAVRSFLAALNSSQPKDKSGGNNGNGKQPSSPKAARAAPTRRAPPRAAKR